MHIFVIRNFQGGETKIH